MNWEEIQVSSKILGHIGAGIYRSAGGAIKELVSNAFDAHAKRVVITTNWPSFDNITCRDNGSGMTAEEFRRIMRGGIGDSQKRKDIISERLDSGGRPVIGRLGIGLLGIAQVCHTFRITSHHKETKTAFQATVKLMDFLHDQADSADSPDSAINDTTEVFDIGQFSLHPIEYSPEDNGTYIVTTDIRSAFVTKFRDSVNRAIPSKFSAFLEEIHRKRFVRDWGDYWEMVWELAISCPVPYSKNQTFNWKTITALEGGENDTRKVMAELDQTQQALESYDFEVVIDGLSLRKPLAFPSPKASRNGRQMTGQVTLIEEDKEVYGKRLKLRGYIYLQDGQAIEPGELRGILIRIRNVAIGTYDSTFLNYPNIEGPRFNWLSGEIYVEAGLEDALNIDRDSFNEMHPHYVRLQKVLHETLTRIFTVASKGIDVRTQDRHEQTRKQRLESLKSVLERDLGSGYDLVEIEDSETPVYIDKETRKVYISTRRSLWPKSKSQIEVAQLVSIAFEIAWLAAPALRKKRFYQLLSELLNAK